MIEHVHANGPMSMKSNDTRFQFLPADYPTSPGVYFMKNSQGRILYVGKAKNLRARLSSYFRETGIAPKTAALVAKIASIDTLAAESEKEALLIEASLIKKHRPHYNIVLRDDKQYILFKIDKTVDFPRLAFTRNVLADKATYFGPFTSSSAARATWKELGRIFPIRKCSDKSFRNRVRPCLYHHIGQCLAPCVNAISKEEYRRLVRRVEDFLRGRSQEVIKSVEREMYAASDAMDFEKAAQLRDLVKAMRKTVEGQAAVLPRLEDLDVVDTAVTGAGLGLCILFVRQGQVIGRKNYFWSDRGEDDIQEAVLGFLGQFYGPQRFIPPRILLPDTVNLVNDDENIIDALVEVLTERRGDPVRLTHAVKKDEKPLLALAQTNALQAVVEAGDGSKHRIVALLRHALKLGRDPVRIETIDVSHLGGTNTRVGQIVYENGHPAKSEYRIYAPEEAEGSGDDYLALAEWVRCRLDSGPPWPDLALIDGGKGQLRAVERALEDAGQLGLFEIASIAKAGRAKHELGDVIFRPGRKNSLNLRPGSQELLFLQRLRDTAHDFVIRGQRRARKKAGLASELLAVPGVGPKTARRLWDAFGSVDNMRKAGEEALAAVPGIGKNKAAIIWQALASQKP
ncbi:excinuclease ABC subunit UvrC [Desulfovibrio inopinatus]|uniref:excinuclease ABC subunit UvrC n=1 Tax=Desulfovibrio inopinatus TaxID=102109 RepID=UPI000401030A|nr:excinuclease ABC subunit UvrC [Desulfovibrio inopinatus]